MRARAQERRGGREGRRVRSSRGGSAHRAASAHVLRALDGAFDHQAWHGPNLLSAIRGVGYAEAAWRPGPGRHCIEEIVVHCAYWKYRVLRRVATPESDLPDAFPRTGSDWFVAPEPLTEGAWRADVALLKRIHAVLRDAASAMDDQVLERPGPRQKRNRRQNLEGIAFHDMYHAGQIRILRKLYEEVKG